MTSSWSLYVLRTRDAQLYTGVATDVGRRLAEHEAGGARAAKYLRGRGPLELVFEREIGERGLALRAEQRLKRVPRAEKERIVSEGLATGELLARLGLG